MQAEAAKCAFVHVTAAAELGNGQNEANRYSGWLPIAATLVTNRDAGAIAGVSQFAERDPSKGRCREFEPRLRPSVYGVAARQNADRKGAALLRAWDQARRPFGWP